MRLTCPNCGARYEVDEAMIPAEGRDVQCSNCTTTWFQPGVRQTGEAAADDAPPPERPVRYRENTRPLDDPERAPEAPQQRRELDPEVRDVLREEAEREAALRREESGRIETQEEMPLAEPDEDSELGAVVSDVVAGADEIGDLEDAPRDRARSEASARYADDAAAQDAVEAEIAAAAAAENQAGSRRDLLPDIEEINSTLRATDDRSAGTGGEAEYGIGDARPRRRGTRLGFGLAILIFAALVAIYVNAGRISAALPQITPVIQGYVDQVDRLRAWVDEIAQGALTSDDAPQEAPEPTQEDGAGEEEETGAAEADEAEDG